MNYEEWAEWTLPPTRGCRTDETKTSDGAIVGDGLMLQEEERMMVSRIETLYRY